MPVESKDQEFLSLFKDTLFVSIPKDGGGLIHTRNIDKILALNATAPVGAYFTVNGFKMFEEGSFYGRTKMNCSSLNANFLDIDLTPETRRMQAELIYKELVDGGLQPTAVVLTGKGLHVYWVYENPIDIDVKKASGYEVLQSAIVEKFKVRGADPQARDIARVLRIPGAKYYDKQGAHTTDVELMYLNKEKKYTPQQVADYFKDYIKLDTEAGKAIIQEGSDFDLKTMLNVKEGSRHHDAYSAALSIIQSAKTLGHARKIFEAFVSTWQSPDWPDMWRQFEQAKLKIEGENPNIFITETSDPIVKVTVFDDIEEKPIEWLWDGFIAKGKPHMLTGDPGLGKSQITVDIAARLSTGAPFPSILVGGQTFDHKEPIGTIILSAEDDAGDTIRPRLRAAGANLKYVVSMAASVIEKDKKGKATMRGFALKDDAEKLLHAIATLPFKVGLIIIDPIMAFMSSSQDSNSSSDVRGTLAQLQAVIMEKGIALLMINHNNKNTSAKGAHMKSMGSVGWNAAARATFYVFRDSEDPERRVFSIGKMNLAKDSSNGFFYKVKDKMLDIAGQKISTPYIEWDTKQFPNKSADEYTEESGKKQGFKYEKCENDLKFFMADKKEVKAKDALGYMKERGYSQVDVYKAANKLGYVSEQYGIWRT
jgi:RecA-family ATPase